MVYHACPTGGWQKAVEAAEKWARTGARDGLPRFALELRSAGEQAAERCKHMQAHTLRQHGAGG
jgi:hypothetical protein